MPSPPTVCPECRQSHPEIELIAGHNGHGYGCTACQTVLGTSDTHARRKLELAEP